MNELHCLKLLDFSMEILGSILSPIINKEKAWTIYIKEILFSIKKDNPVILNKLYAKAKLILLQ